MKDDTKSYGLTSQRNIGSSAREDDIETEIGICFPIVVVVSVSLNSSSSTEIASQSKIARFLNSFCSSVYGISKPSSLSKSVPQSGYTFFGKKCLTRFLQVVKCPSKFAALLMN